MQRSNETLARVHDLRVLMSAIQMDADEVLGPAHELVGASRELRDQIELVAEILRIWSLCETDVTHMPTRAVDLRAVAFLARAGHAETTLADMGVPVRAHVRPQALLELLDLVLYWSGGELGRTRIEVRPEPAVIAVNAIGEARVGSDRADLEVEHAIESLAAASRIEPVLDRGQRIALLQLTQDDDGLDG